MIMGTHPYQTLRYVTQDVDGGYTMIGGTYSSYSGDLDNADIILIKADSNGNKIWEQSLGGLAYDVGYKFIQISDSEYIIIGLTQSYGAGGKDGWLIKVSAEIIEN